MSHHILIVDDQPELAAMIADLLADAGYATRTAGDGRAALSEVQADPLKTEPGFIGEDSLARARKEAKRATAQRRGRR